MNLEQGVSTAVGIFGILAFIGSIVVWVLNRGTREGTMESTIKKLSEMCQVHGSELNDVVKRLEEQEKETAVLQTEVKGINSGILRIETSLESMRNETTKVLLSIQKQTRG